MTKRLSRIIIMMLFSSVLESTQGVKRSPSSELDRYQKQPAPSASYSPLFKLVFADMSFAMANIREQLEHERTSDKPSLRSLAQWYRNDGRYERAEIMDMLGAQQVNASNLYTAYLVVAGKTLPTLPETQSYARNLIASAERRNDPHALFYVAELALQRGDLGHARFYYTLVCAYADSSSAVAYAATMREKELARNRTVLIVDSF